MRNLLDINTSANKATLPFLKLERQAVEEFKYNHKEANTYNKLSVSGYSLLG